MVGEDRNAVCSFEGLLEWLRRVHCIWNQGVVDRNEDFVSAESVDDFDGGAFPDIVGVPFERDSENRDFWSRNSLDESKDFSGDRCRSIIVDLAGARDHLRRNRTVKKEPRIHRDAVTAHSRPRPENPNARMVVREVDGLPYVDSMRFRECCEFVRECHVHVPKRVFCQFDELRGIQIREVDFPRDEFRVEIASPFRRGVIQSSDYAIIFRDFSNNISWQHSLWAVCKAEIRAGSKPALLENRQDHFQRRSGGDGGFEDYR